MIDREKFIRNLFLRTDAAEVIQELLPVTTAPEAGNQALPRDLLDLEAAQVLDAMPRRGGMSTVRVAQRAGLAPATTAGCLGKLAIAGFVERCDAGWRLRP